jgi:hypothetical protein
MGEDRYKRELRKEKRAVKRAGGKHRRRAAKDILRTNPEEAAFKEDSVGRYQSEKYNGLDEDSTRKVRDE